MKNIIFLLSVPLWLLSQENSKLSVSEHNSIHNYNNRPIVKMNKQNKMHQLHKIDESEAAVIAQKVTGEKANTIKLFHRGRTLQYHITTKKHNVYINALDGNVIELSSKQTDN